METLRFALLADTLARGQTTPVPPLPEQTRTLWQVRRHPHFNLFILILAQGMIDRIYLPVTTLPGSSLIGHPQQDGYSGKDINQGIRPV